MIDERVEAIDWAWKDRGAVVGLIQEQRDTGMIFRFIVYPTEIGATCGGRARIAEEAADVHTIAVCLKE